MVRASTHFTLGTNSFIPRYSWSPSCSTVHMVITSDACLLSISRSVLITDWLTAGDVETALEDQRTDSTTLLKARKPNFAL